MTATQSNTASPADRRVTLRRQPAIGTICRLTSGNGPKPGVGLVWNISHGGVSLLVNMPIPPGTAVAGELITMNEKARMAVVFHVSHLSKLQTGDYCIGGKFDRLLTDGEMKPFLG